MSNIEELNEKLASIKEIIEKGTSADAILYKKLLEFIKAKITVELVKEIIANSDKVTDYISLLDEKIILYEKAAKIMENQNQTQQSTSEYESLLMQIEKLKMLKQYLINNDLKSDFYIKKVFDTFEVDKKFLMHEAISELALGYYEAPELFGEHAFTGGYMEEKINFKVIKKASELLSDETYISEVQNNAALIEKLVKKEGEIKRLQKDKKLYEYIKQNLVELSTLLDFKKLNIGGTNNIQSMYSEIELEKRELETQGARKKELESTLLGRVLYGTEISKLATAISKRKQEVSKKENTLFLIDKNSQNYFLKMFTELSPTHTINEAMRYEMSDLRNECMKLESSEALQSHLADRINSVSSKLSKVEREREEILLQVSTLGLSEKTEKLIKEEPSTCKYMVDYALNPEYTRRSMNVSTAIKILDALAELGNYSVNDLTSLDEINNNLEILTIQYEQIAEKKNNYYEKSIQMYQQPELDAYVETIINNQASGGEQPISISEESKRL